MMLAVCSRHTGRPVLSAGQSSRGASHERHAGARPGANRSDILAPSCGIMALASYLTTLVRQYKERQVDPRKEE